uniref:Uncharacterized protein n=1 Tax=Aegilops tauschii TaxID=37682 RepID=M8AWV5_AEGTA
MGARRVCVCAVAGVVADLVLPCGKLLRRLAASLVLPVGVPALAGSVAVVGFWPAFADDDGGRLLKAHRDSTPVVLVLSDSDKDPVICGIN